MQGGECLSSISFQYGFFVDTLWNHPDNRDLKELRKDPTVLMAGDRLAIPDKKEKTVSVASGATHRFCRKGVPALFSMRLMQGPRPRANLAFVLEVDGQRTSGVTDLQGVLRVYISPSATSATLTLRDDGVEECYQLALGHVDPISELSGVQARLQGLGFYHGEVDGVAGDATTTAVRAFQSQHGLTASGEINDELRSQLVKAFGG